MCSKKGITPVIAIVLLLMLTVSSAAGAYYWITNMQSELQETTEGIIANSGVSGGYEINVLPGGIDCDSSSSEITAFVRNVGTHTIDSDVWYVFVKKSDGSQIGTWKNITLGDLGSNSIMKITFNSSDSMSPDTTYSLIITSPKGTTAIVSCVAN